MKVVCIKVHQNIEITAGDPHISELRGLAPRYEGRQHKSAPTPGNRGALKVPLGDILNRCRVFVMICVPFVYMFGSFFHYIVGMYSLVDIVPVTGYPVAGRTHPIHPIQSNAVLKDQSQDIPRLVRYIQSILSNPML